MSNGGYVMETADTENLPSKGIFIGTEELPKTVPVTAIIVTKAVNRIPTAKIIIEDGDSSKGKFEISDEDYFKPGQEITIKAGYHQKVETVFKGIIVKHAVKVKKKRISKLVVECKDESFKMTLGRKNAYYYDETDSDIMSSIIGGYTKLSADVESITYKHHNMVQYGATDWDFVLTRAEANGKIVIVEDGKIEIKAPNLKQDTEADLKLGGTIMEYEAEIDARIQSKKVNAFTWDSSKQELIDDEGDEPDELDLGNIKASELSDSVEYKEENYYHSGNLQEDEIKQIASAKTLKNRLARIRGRVKYEGVPNVKPGKLIKVDAVGKRFQGTAYVSAVRHEMSNGDWTTDAQLGLSTSWYNEQVKLSEPPAAGILPAVCGLQIGVVTKLYDDPDGQFRIRVQLPTVDKKGDGVWARVCTLDAGAERGSFYRPEVKDEVIVGFINDDPRDAVVLGCVHSQAKESPHAPSDDNNDEKGIVTREGMKLWFNDKSSEKSITIQTKDNHKIYIKDGDSILLETKDSKSSIKLSSNGIEMKTKGNFTVKADGQISLQSKMDATLKSSTGNVTADGAIGAKLKGGALAEVKGGIVKIN